ncbi:MAG: protein-export chaperone SecB [Pseudomonadota bacterium]
MAETTNGNGTTPAQEAGAGEAQQQVQAQVVAQYIKDLSFENPNIEKLLNGPGDNPNMKMEVNVNAKRVGDDLFESAIDFKGHATNKEGTIYVLELVYAGLFRIKNIPDEAMEPFLLINCPALVFPFLRRLVADLSREGGFPPLLLDPIDFAGLYMRRKQQAGEGQPEANA